MYRSARQQTLTKTIKSRIGCAFDAGGGGWKATLAEVPGASQSASWEQWHWNSTHYTVSGGAPLALTQGVEAQLVCDLSNVHRVWQILLVGKHEEHGLAQLVLQAQRRR